MDSEVAIEWSKRIAAAETSEQFDELQEEANELADQNEREWVSDMIAAERHRAQMRAQQDRLLERRQGAP